MNKSAVLFMLCGFLFFIISGCVVRTYPVIKERVDQDLSTGNRGYLFGKPAVIEEKPRSATRKIQVVELELHEMKFGKQPKPSAPSSMAPKEVTATTAVITAPVGPSQAVVMKKYTVRKGDTLQSISKKFYGTTKRWKEIYNVNREVLKSPDEIYLGQIIEIPIEEIPGIK